MDIRVIGTDFTQASLLLVMASFGFSMFLAGLIGWYLMHAYFGPRATRFLTVVVIALGCGVVAGIVHHIRGSSVAGSAILGTEAVLAVIASCFAYLRLCKLLQKPEN